MLSINSEAFFLVPAVVVGTLFLRATFLVEIPPSPAERLPVVLDDFIEAETLGVQQEEPFKHVGFTVQDTTQLAPSIFVNDTFVWYSTNKMDDEVQIPLKVEKPGSYKIAAQLAHGGDFGIVSLRIGEQLLLEKYNLYSQTPKSTSKMELGVVELAEDNILTMKIVGTDPESRSPYFQCGLDGITLTPVSEESGEVDEAAAQ